LTCTRALKPERHGVRFWAAPHGPTSYGREQTNQLSSATAATATAATPVGDTTTRLCAAGTNSALWLGEPAAATATTASAPTTHASGSAARSQPDSGPQRARRDASRIAKQGSTALTLRAIAYSMQPPSEPTPLPSDHGPPFTFIRQICKPNMASGSQAKTRCVFARRGALGWARVCSSASRSPRGNGPRRRRARVEEP